MASKDGLRIWIRLYCRATPGTGRSCWTGGQLAVWWIWKGGQFAAWWRRGGGMVAAWCSRWILEEFWICSKELSSKGKVANNTAPALLVLEWKNWAVTGSNGQTAWAAPLRLRLLYIQYTYGWRKWCDSEIHQDFRCFSLKHYCMTGVKCEFRRQSGSRQLWEFCWKKRPKRKKWNFSWKQQFASSCPHLLSFWRKLVIEVFKLLCNVPGSMIKKI